MSETKAGSRPSDSRSAAFRLGVESLCFVLIITAMVGASELLSNSEIIFPEIAAIATGCFLAPQMTWKTSFLRMFLFISICAVLGVGIVLFLPGPLWLQFTAAYLIGQVIFRMSGTTFAPMISAICLPVLIQTRSIVYIAAAILLTGAIILVRIFLEKTGLKHSPEFAPVQRLSSKNVLMLAARTALVLLMAVPALKLGFRFCMAPPLLVAFTELTNPNCPAAKRNVHAILLVFLCAVTGAGLRLLLTVTLGLPLIVAAIPAALLVLLWIRCFRMYFPPAAALAFLAFLIPESAVVTYPFQVLAGIVIFDVAAIPLRKLEY